MVSLEWDVERTDGVTLVSLSVTSERECRVRIENRLDGPVWPPRRHGQPAAGWDGDKFTGTVPADGLLTVGYATSAQPAEPPAAVVATEPPEGRDDGDTVAGDWLADGEQSAAGGGIANGGHSAMAAPSVERTPAGVVRSLGDPVVPRDCVPLPDEDSGDDEDPEDDETPDGADTAGSGRLDRSRESGKRDIRRAGRLPTDGRGGDALLVPGAVRAWLRDVERRRDAAADARAVGVEEGVDHAATLADAAAADRRAIAWVEQRIDEVTRRPDGDEVTRRPDGDGVTRRPDSEVR